jgi:hypothetical protein
MACTSQLQQWHKKGGGSNIAPEPVMEVFVNKTKLDEARVRSGVKPLLYEARMKVTHDNNAEHKLKEELKNINPNVGFAQMLCEKDAQETPNVETKFGKCKVGSYLSYQVTLTESNFKATADIDCVPRLLVVNEQQLNYLRFPLRNMEEMIFPANLTDDESTVISKIQLNEDEINKIETETRKQAECDKWKDERKYRFTASRFHLISKRKRNHKTFAETLINPKLISSKYLEHGKKYEPVALIEYQKFMFNRKTPVHVLNNGFVVSKGFPILGASPDSKVIDPGCIYNFGLA